MESLASKACVPCHGDIPPLTAGEISKLHFHVSDWHVEDDKKIRKIYYFKNFATALNFVNEIGAEAERQEHHPDLYLGWGKVEVILWTHKVGGLTQNDFIFAAKTNIIAQTAPGQKASHT